MTLFRKVVILAHRYLGIALSALVFVWFASGMVMMYAGGMPRLTPQLRLERLPDLDLTRVKLTPAEAAMRGGLEDSPGRVVLSTVTGRPAYRFAAGPTTVFADTGELLTPFGVPESKTLVSRFMDRPEGEIEFDRTVTEVDQWTIGQGRALPLHKFRVNDDAAAELYVSPRTGEVAMLTTRGTRMLAWVGVIPHWLYFAALRVNQPLWYRIVVWTSAFACVLTVLGLILGVTQFRRQRPFRLAAAIPYSGWMRWHYITGAVFGVFTLTWAFSGLLSMEPFTWTNATGLEVDRSVLTGGPVQLASFTPVDPAAWNRALDGRAVREVEYARIQDEHYYVVRQAPGAAPSPRRERLHQPYPVGGQSEPDQLLMTAATLEIRREPFSTDSVISRLKAEYPDVPILEQRLLNEYDSYYYSRRQLTPLPVLRIKFGDPAETWVYVDPEVSQVLAEIHRLNRVERWLYNGLHSLDFAFWYNSRLWDVGMLALCLGGLASSGLGLLLGVRRLRRATVRTARAWSAVPAPKGSAVPTATASGR